MLGEVCIELIKLNNVSDVGLGQGIKKATER